MPLAWYLHPVKIPRPPPQRKPVGKSPATRRPLGGHQRVLIGLISLPGPRSLFHLNLHLNCGSTSGWSFKTQGQNDVKNFEDFLFLFVPKKNRFVTSPTPPLDSAEAKYCPTFHFFRAFVHSRDISHFSNAYRHICYHMYEYIHTYNGIYEYESLIRIRLDRKWS